VHILILQNAGILTYLKIHEIFKECSAPWVQFLLGWLVIYLDGWLVGWLDS